MKKFSRQIYIDFIQIIIILLFLITSYQINNYINKPKITISKQDSALNLNPMLVDFFSMGYKRFITAIVWVSTILESDHEHYKNKDNNSWMFLRFDFISQLDNKFYENYAFGGPYLSIIKDDDVGAKAIYDKGLIFYPNDYELLLNAGFHYYFELNNPSHAASLYKKLVSYPQTPKYVLSFYAKMISNEYATEEAFRILQELYEKNKHIEDFEKRYRESLYAIRAEIDLGCLNSSKNIETCRKVDLYNNPYVLKNGTYSAAIPWKKFKIYKKFNNE